MDNRKSKYQSGVTLIEIIVVVAILAVLASMAMYGLRAPSDDVDAARLRSVAADLCDAANTYNAFQNNTDRGVLTDAKLRSITGTHNTAFYQKEDLPDGATVELWTLNVGLRQAFGDDFTQYWLVTMTKEEWAAVLSYVEFNAAQFRFELLAEAP